MRQVSSRMLERDGAKERTSGLPRISVVTVTYNAAQTLARCIRSVSMQRGVQKEHIVVDGASTDQTLAILRRHADVLDVCVSRPDRGLYDAMNRGIALARGEVVGFLHADDEYPHAEVLAQVAACFRDFDVDACYADLCYVRQEAPHEIVRYWRAGSYHPRKFYRGWMPPHPTFFVRRAVYEALGGYRLDLGTAADYELMLRYLLVHRIRVRYLPRTLVHMRTGGLSNASWRRRLAAHLMDRKAWKVNGLRPMPWTFLLKPLSKVPQWWQVPEGDRGGCVDCAGKK